MQKDAGHRQVAFKAGDGLGHPSSPPVIQIPTPISNLRKLLVDCNFYIRGAVGILI